MLESIVEREIQKNDLLKIIKKSKSKGRCLHFNKCSHTDIINSHSISKNLIQKISVNGKAYSYKSDMFNYKKRNGEILVALQGASKLSIFKGFCHKHDNGLFKIIDNNKFLTNRAQASLYAYRSICREIIVREQILSYFPNIRFDENDEAKLNMQLISFGLMHGSELLNHHQKNYAQSFQKENISKFRYTLFRVKGDPNILFSGVFFPDYDFQGNVIQDLSDFEILHQLITVSSVPLDDGWGILFAWHYSSDYIVNELLNSFKQSIKDGNNISDLLFRLIITRVENIVISPLWWESLAEIDKNNIIARFSYEKKPDNPIIKDYLVSGLTGISDWEIEYLNEEVD